MNADKLVSHLRQLVHDLSEEKRCELLQILSLPSTNSNRSSSSSSNVNEPLAIHSSSSAVSPSSLSGYNLRPCRKTSPSSGPSSEDETDAVVSSRAEPLQRHPTTGLLLVPPPLKRPTQTAVSKNKKESTKVEPEPVTDLSVWVSQHFVCPGLCSIACGATFTTWSDLLGHMISTHGEARVSCRWCHGMFANMALFHAHECEPVAVWLRKRDAAHLSVIAPPECAVPRACPRCMDGRRWRSRKALDKHLRSHPELKFQSCCHCNTTFTFRQELFAHLVESHGLQTCPFCGLWAASDLEPLARHVKEVHYRHYGPLICLVCKRSMDDVSLAENHAAFAHRNLCVFCHTCFVRNCNLQLHLKSAHAAQLLEDVTPSSSPSTSTAISAVTSSGNRSRAVLLKSARLRLILAQRRQQHGTPRQSYPTRWTSTTTRDSKRLLFCETCQVQFMTLLRFQRHRYIHHGQVPTLPHCTKCKSCFRSHMGLKVHCATQTHRAKVETLGLRFKCHCCSRVYRTKGTLTRHVQQQHSNSPRSTRPVCEKCGYMARDQHALKQHMNRHENIRPHVCDVCNASFCDKSTLTDHKTLKHSTENDWLCEQCGKQFKLRRCLMRHLRDVHCENKSFMCGLCQTSFKARNSLMQHMRKKHPTMSLVPLPKTSPTGPLPVPDGSSNRNSPLPPMNLVPLSPSASVYPPAGPTPTTAPGGAYRDMYSYSGFNLHHLVNLEAEAVHLPMPSEVDTTCFSLDMELFVHDHLIGEDTSKSTSASGNPASYLHSTSPGTTSSSRGILYPLDESAGPRAPAVPSIWRPVSMEQQQQHRGGRFESSLEDGTASSRSHSLAFSVTSMNGKTDTSSFYPGNHASTSSNDAPLIPINSIFSTPSVMPYFYQQPQDPPQFTYGYPTSAPTEIYSTGPYSGVDLDAQYVQSQQFTSPVPHSAAAMLGPVQMVEHIAFLDYGQPSGPSGPEETTHNPAGYESKFLVKDIIGQHRPLGPG